MMTTGAVRPIIDVGINQLSVVGAPASQPGLVLLDFCGLSQGSVVLLGGDSLLISPYSPTYTTLPVAANAFGQANFAFPGAGLPAGLQLSAQFAINDPLAPAGSIGVCLSDLLTFTTARR